eukprot:TRINITY_DN2944_c0_g2_i1.p1 TRINITY_DN2944_c0_g2~~TRINITY_DN2944_c0_g2_i1.p1  ORF type:complete len:999 (+),score=211.16 TRINITY_DN2944_c0_g2_i1:292-2997(+)
MIGRTLKVKIWEKIREFTELSSFFPGDYSCKQAIVKYFNKIFNDEGQSIKFWTEEIKQLLIEKFHIPQSGSKPGDFLSEVELAEDYNLLHSIHIPQLFAFLGENMNLKVDQSIYKLFVDTPTLWKSLCDEDTNPCEYIETFKDRHILDLPCKIKEMSITELAFIYEQIEDLWTDFLDSFLIPKNTETIYNITIPHVNRAMSSSYVSLITFSSAKLNYLMALYVRQYNVAQLNASDFLNQAQSLISISLELDVNNPHSNLLQALILFSHAVNKLDLTSIRKAFTRSLQQGVSALEPTIWKLMERIAMKSNSTGIFIPQFTIELCTAILNVNPDNIMAHFHLWQIQILLMEMKNYTLLQIILDSYSWTEKALYEKAAFHLEQMFEIDSSKAHQLISDTVIIRETLHGIPAGYLFILANYNPKMNNLVKGYFETNTEFNWNETFSPSFPKTELGDFAKFLPNLKTMTLPILFEDIYKTFQHCKNLQSLKITNPSTAFQKLTDFVDFCTIVKTLTSLEVPSWGNEGNSKELWEAIGSLPITELITGLDYLVDDNLISFFTKNQGKLKTVKFLGSGCQIGYDWVEHLYKNCTLLESLSLKANIVEDNQLRSIFEHCKKLVEISLESIEMSPETVESLSKMENISTLSLNSIAWPFPSPPLFSSLLTCLSLIETPQMTDFTNFSPLTNLRSLTLQRCYQFNRTNDLSSQLTPLQKLTHLHLDQSASYWMTDTTISNLVKGKQNLVELSFAKGISDTGLCAIFQYCASMKYLSIAKCTIGNQFINFLSSQDCTLKKTSSQTGLTSFICSSSAWPKKSLGVFLQSQPNLSTLSLEESSFTQKSLMEVGCLQDLSYLSLYFTKYQKTNNILRHIYLNCSKLQSIRVTGMTADINIPFLKKIRGQVQISTH